MKRGLGMIAALVEVSNDQDAPCRRRCRGATAMSLSTHWRHRAMGDTRWVVAALVVALHVPCADAQVRLEGLGRVYFERVAEPGAPAQLPESVAPFLPEKLQEPELALRRADDDSETRLEVTVQDFELPAHSPNGRMWIREVVVNGYMRIAELRWALYDGGRRSDVWRFMPQSQIQDKKILTNYRLDSLAMPATDAAVLRVRGEMSRPGGSWTITGKEWFFTVSATAITLVRVRNAFGYLQGYEVDGGSFSVSTEQEVDGRLENRVVDAGTAQEPGTCRFPDPVVEGWKFSWADLSSTAHCITSRPGAVVTWRDWSTPSFIERARSP